MAKIIRISEAVRDLTALTEDETYFVYNGADAVVTHMVHTRLASKLVKGSNTNPCAALSYQFVRAMQGCALDMMRRGVMIDQKQRAAETERYTTIRNEAQRRLDLLAGAVWGPEQYEIVEKTKELWQPIGKRGHLLSPRFRTVTKRASALRPRGLNPGSPIQVLAFFNIALKMPQVMGLRKTKEGNVRTPTANDKALKRWGEIKTKGPGIPARVREEEYVRYAQPFVSLILTIRDADKMLGVLNTGLSDDGRMRCSYNVVGTESGRWSSSSNAFGSGTNIQNINETMRRMFCADDGFRFISTDLEQAESRLVAALVWQATGDTLYWDACESSDLHTAVVRMTWPELGWTNDLIKDRAIAEQPYPGIPRFSYRDVAKRLGHGSNYNGSAFGIAQAVGVPVKVVDEFQGRYFRAFPALRSWHRWTAQQLIENQYIDTPLGRRRFFFGRPTEDATLREAIAHVPQSTIGELLNLALLHTWYRTLPDAQRSRLYPNTTRLPIQLLLQNHDAFAFQIPNALDPAPILEEVRRELEIPIPIQRGNETRWLTIPGEFVTGWNWAKHDPDCKHFEDTNPDGLRKWKGHDTRVRQHPARTTMQDWLNRPIT